MKYLVTLTALLLSISAFSQAPSIKVSKVVDIPKCDLQNLDYTVYTVADTETEIDGKNLNIRFEVDLYRCLKTERGLSYQPLDSKAPSMLSNGKLLSEYQNFNFIAFSDDFDLITESQYQNGEVTLSIPLSELEDNGLSFNLVPRTLEVFSNPEGEFLFQKANVWNHLKVDIQL